MPLDLCLEASGSVAHFLAADAAQARLPLRWRLRRSNGRHGGAGSLSAAAADGRLRVLDRRVGDAIDRLPFLLAHVLWLIDVCRCSYETAAVELGVTPERVQELVVEARELVRHDASVADAAPPVPAAGRRRRP